MVNVSSDIHQFTSSESSYNIDTNGFHIKPMTFLILRQNVNHWTTSALLCAIYIIIVSAKQRSSYTLLTSAIQYQVL